MKHLNHPKSKKWWRRLTVFSLASILALGPMFQGIGISKISKDCAPGFSAANPMIIAHRGSTAGYPENSLAAVTASSRLETISGLEFDVRSTKDGVQVLMHDPTLNRTTTGSGKVAALPFARLSSYKLRMSKTTQAVPELSEVIDVIPESKIAFVEMKYGSDPKMILSIVAGRHQESTYIISSSKRSLLAARELAPQLRRGLIWGNGDSAELWRLIREIRPSSIILNERSATGALLLKLKSRNIDTFLWTINDPVAMKKWMLTPTVTGIISDYPETAVQVRSSLTCTI